MWVLKEIISKRKERNHHKATLIAPSKSSLESLLVRLAWCTTYSNDAHTKSNRRKIDGGGGGSKRAMRKEPQLLTHIYDQNQLIEFIVLHLNLFIFPLWLTSHLKRRKIGFTTSFWQRRQSIYEKWAVDCQREQQSDIVIENENEFDKRPCWIEKIHNRASEWDTEMREKIKETTFTHRNDGGLRESGKNGKF